jgi:hypothetical protein
VISPPASTGRWSPWVDNRQSSLGCTVVTIRREFPSVILLEMAQKACHTTRECRAFLGAPDSLLSISTGCWDAWDDRENDSKVGVNAKRKHEKIEISQLPLEDIDRIYISISHPLMPGPPASRTQLPIMTTLKVTPVELV